MAAPTYLAAMAICTQLAPRPGLCWLNLLVTLLYWNALKFGDIAPFALVARGCGIECLSQPVRCVVAAKRLAVCVLGRRIWWSEDRARVVTFLSRKSGQSPAAGAEYANRC